MRLATRLATFDPLEFGKKVQARSLLVFGQSAAPASSHYFDEAELYCKQRFKPAWFDLCKSSATSKPSNGRGGVRLCLAHSSAARMFFRYHTINSIAAPGSHFTCCAALPSRNETS